MRSNIAANILANVVIAVVYFVSVPLLIRYIGVEGYGLVGFFLIAQSLAAVLDLGLMTMLTREFAVLNAKDGNGPGLRDLLRTSEIFYWCAAIVGGLGWIASAGFLSWFVNPQGIGDDTLYQCFLLMGGTFALQFPVGLYSGALFGLQRQVAISWVSVAFSILRNLGAVAALHYLSSTPQIFFAWQLGCAALQVPFLAVLVRSSLPIAVRPAACRPGLITEKWRLVAGIGLITLAFAILANQDKFILARLIPLDEFGYYAIAAVAASGIQWLVQPVFKAMLPRLSQLAGSADRASLSTLYHQGCQLLTIIVLPATALWAFFPGELVFLWQQDNTIAANTQVFVTLLMASAFLNGVLFMPYALQLAYGSTRLHLAAALVAVVISVPLTIVLAMKFGGTGAAAVGLGINAAMILFVVPAMHRRMLEGETVRWFRDDMVLQLAAVATVGVAGRFALHSPSSTFVEILQLGVILAAMTSAAVFASSEARRWIGKRLRKE